uniref:Uncharacterized protein n=1 Tax=Magallana gigas TaxID=29159 RepID=K1PQ48_MAGGI
MTANSNTSRVTLSHDLQEAPAYVKVEARTKNGFTFPAFGSAQQDDDDTRAIYGGVVFVYDSTHIDIFVPHYSNDGASRSKWAAVYTGNEHKWIGPGNISRLFETITVQAKAWRSRDLPPITWKSQAINVSTNYGLLCVDDGWGERRLSLRTGNGQVTVTAWTFYRNGSGLRKTLADIDAEDHLVLVADNLTEYTFVNVQKLGSANGTVCYVIIVRSKLSKS